MAGVSELVIRPVSLVQTRRLRQAILRPHQTLAEMAGSEAPGAFAIGAFEGEGLVSVGLIAPDGEPDSWRVRGMATEAHARGRGAGSAILRALLQHARERGARRVWCNARTPARVFYERAGMKATSGEFDVPEIGPHLVMEVDLKGG